MVLLWAAGSFRPGPWRLGPLSKHGPGSSPGSCAVCKHLKRPSGLSGPVLTCPTAVMALASWAGEARRSVGISAGPSPGILPGTCREAGPSQAQHGGAGRPGPCSGPESSAGPWAWGVRLCPSWLAAALCWYIRCPGRWTKPGGHVRMVVAVFMLYRFAHLVHCPTLRLRWPERSSCPRP